MRVKERPVDTRPFWYRRSMFGENISNGNWIISLTLVLIAAGAVQQGWILAAVPLGVAGLLSIVWNDGVAKATGIIGAWLTAGGISAFLLGMATTSMFGSPTIGHVIGLVVAIGGIVATID